MTIVALSILLALVGIVTLRLAGFNYLGTQPHPLAFPIGMQLFLVAIPGALAVGLFDMPLAYELQDEISASVMQYGVVSTMASIGILLLLLALVFRTRILVPLRYQPSEDYVQPLRWLTAISAVVLVIKLMSVSEIPLVLAIKGDVQGAAEAKVRILTNLEGVTTFGLNYIFRSYTSIVYLIALMGLAYDVGNKAKRKLLLWNLPLMLVNAVYDVQKYTLVLLILLTFWVYYTRAGRARYIVQGALLGVVLSILMFVITLGYDFDTELLKSTFYRLFVGQMEGMFFIYEFLKPDGDYGWLGMPLAGLFQLPQIDPAADVVQILFPTAGDTWLNANTYYLAHAWAIFGGASIVIAPLFVVLNLVLMLRIAQPLVRAEPAIYLPVALWQLARLPLVNIFTEFMYFKVALDFIFNIGFVWLIVSCTRSQTQALKRSTS